MTDLLVTNLRDGVLTIELRGVTDQNPMSEALNLEIQRACAEAQDDERVRAVIFTGGEGRSFCAGGDFNEVSVMREGEAVDGWIDRTLALYVAVLSLDKPTIAAVDGFAIGLGFQMALCCDFRLATPRAQFIMWELKHGIACTVGAFMLERFLSRAAMLDLIYDCEPVDLRRAVADRLVYAVTPPETLLEDARRLAAKISAYPELPRRETKRVVNAKFIDGLLRGGPESRSVHRDAFASQAAGAHFQRILGR